MNVTAATPSCHLPPVLVKCVNNRFNNHWSILLAANRIKDVLACRQALGQLPVSTQLCGVPNGTEALAYLSGQDAYGDRDTHPFPNVVLIGCRMPVLSGWAALCLLRSNPLLERLPVVLVGKEFSADQVEAAGRLKAACCSRKSPPMLLLQSMTRSVRLTAGETPPEISEEAPSGWRSILRPAAIRNQIPARFY